MEKYMEDLLDRLNLLTLEIVQNYIPDPETDRRLSQVVVVFRGLAEGVIAPEEDKDESQDQ